MRMNRTLGRDKRRLSEATQERYGGLFAQITETVKELPPRHADRLLEWSTYTRLPSRLRWLAVHLLERRR